MAWASLISSLSLSLIILVPVGVKWEIPKRVTIPASIIIGILTGFIVRGLVGIYQIGFYLLLLVELIFIVAISVSCLLWRFYRDPERIPPHDRNAILSPADGKVIYVKRIERGTIPYCEKNGRKFHIKDFVRSDALPTEGYLIGISMNFLNVHVNRAPIDGKVSLIRLIKGGFISLKKKEAVIENERALTIIDSGLFKVGVIQIASRLVRTIVVFLREGNEVRRGDKMGMIRFGSQVDLILPSLASLNIEATPGEEVKAGLSIVARIVGNQENR